MTFKDDAVAALRAGQNAEITDPNPYRDGPPILRRLWMRGFETMLTIRSAATPAMQTYLREKDDPEGPAGAPDWGSNR